MQGNEEQRQLRERYLIALIEATQPFQKGSTDPEITLDLLIDAAEALKTHLLNERAELRTEQVG